MAAHLYRIFELRKKQVVYRAVRTINGYLSVNHRGMVIRDESAFVEVSMRMLTRAFNIYGFY